MHQIPEEDNVAQNRLCWECIGEPFLSAKVEKEGELARCTYCDLELKTFSLAEVADAVEAVFEKHYYKTSLNSHEWPYETSYRKGAAVLYVVEELVDVRKAVANDILGVLSNRHFDIESARIGEECPFDPMAHYADKRVSPAQFDAEWAYFEQDLRTNTRYFNRTGAAFLSSVFECIGELRKEDGRPVVVEAGPGQTISALYRARVFQSVEKLQSAVERPDVELGPPPARLASAGRMNAFGISVFYGAVEPETAIAEVRPPVGSRVLLGRFDITRPLCLLDLEVLRAIYVKGSLFDPSFAHNLERAKFLAGLSRRMTKPVMPEQEPFEHLATHAIADFLSSEAAPKLDGIVYPSVQVSGGKLNVVLFHKAARVEALELPKNTEVSSRCFWVDTSEDEHRYSDEEYEEYEQSYGDEGDSYWVFEEVPPVASQAPEPKPHTVFSLPPLPSTTEYDNRTPALKLDLPSVEVRRILEVTFKTASFTVDRSRREKSPPLDLTSIDDVPF